MLASKHHRRSRAHLARVWESPRPRGLGRDYLFAAKEDFGNGRVHRDIVQFVRWLLAQGIGDPERIAITGAVFGGYSVLQGLTFQPELFKVGIAAVPPACRSAALHTTQRLCAR